MKPVRCRWCGRSVLVRVNGRYKTSKDHDLCQQCWESQLAKRAPKRPTQPRGPQVPMPELLEEES